jgi:hypothetical protein
MLTKQQVKLIQTAVRAAGIRSGRFDGRYRLLLGQYKQYNKRPVTSCKQLTNRQLDDLLAICESLGFRMPGKGENFLRNKVIRGTDEISFAQQEAIRHLTGDIGWSDIQLEGFLRRMTMDKIQYLPALTAKQAYDLIEALKAMVIRKIGKPCNNLQDMKTAMEGDRDGQKQTS